MKELRKHSFLYASNEGFSFTSADILPTLQKLSYGLVPVRRDLEAFHNPSHWAYSFAIHVVKNCGEEHLKSALNVLFQSEDTCHVELAKNIQVMLPSALSRQTPIVSPESLWDAFWNHVRSERYQSGAWIIDCLLSFQTDCHLPEDNSLMDVLHLVDVPENLKNGILKLMVLHNSERLLAFPEVLLAADAHKSMMRFCSALGAISAAKDLKIFYDTVRDSLSRKNVSLDNTIIERIEKMIAARKKQDRNG